MADAVVVTCPRCGAGLQGAPDATRAQCQYCGTIVELKRPGPEQAYAPLVAASVKANRTVMFVWIGVVATIMLFSAGMSFWQTRSASGGSLGLSLPAGKESVKISAPDPKALDPTSLIQQAGAAVRQRGSNCELTYAYIGTLSGGALDATGSDSLLNFTCRSVDPNKPPGQDISDDEWSVRVFHGYLTLDKSGFGSHEDPPWREPTCPFSQAWATAVATGVPANSLVSVYFRDTAWSLSVNGHPELSREIDGSTCHLARH
jgi:hypothetical protein